jgi:hypothetical protein
LPRNKSGPHCPACGSSATLPFEKEGNGRNGQTFSEIILIGLSLFLILFAVLLLLLLSHAALPIGTSLALVVFLLWRRHGESRRARLRPHRFVCLDCSHNFKA